MLNAVNDDSIRKAAEAEDIIVLADDPSVEPGEEYIDNALKPRPKNTLANLLSTGRALSKSDDPMEGMKSLSRSNSRSTSRANSRRASRSHHSMHRGASAGSGLRASATTERVVRVDSTGDLGLGSPSTKSLALPDHHYVPSLPTVDSIDLAVADVPSLSTVDDDGASGMPHDHTPHILVFLPSLLPSFLPSLSFFLFPSFFPIRHRPPHPLHPLLSHRV